MVLLSQNLRLLDLDIAISVTSWNAFADHTLQDAMNENANLEQAVTAIEKAAEVSCSFDESEQTMPSPTLVMQVAYCYAASEHGEGDGGIIGQLQVTYTWIQSWDKSYPGHIKNILFESTQD